MEPDFGSTVVIVATVFGMMFLGGIRYLHFFMILGIAVMGGVLLVTFAAYGCSVLSVLWIHGLIR